MARRCCCARDKADLRVLDDRLTGNEGLGRQRAFDCQAYGSGVDAGQDGDAIPPGPVGWPGCGLSKGEGGPRRQGVPAGSGTGSCRVWSCRHRQQPTAGRGEARRHDAGPHDHRGCDRVAMGLVIREEEAYRPGGSGRLSSRRPASGRRAPGLPDYLVLPTFWSADGAVLPGVTAGLGAVMPVSGPVAALVELGAFHSGMLFNSSAVRDTRNTPVPVSHWRSSIGRATWWAPMPSTPPTLTTTRSTCLESGFISTVWMSPIFLSSLPRTSVPRTFDTSSVSNGLGRSTGAVGAVPTMPAPGAAPGVTAEEPVGEGAVAPGMGVLGAVAVSRLG